MIVQLLKRLKMVLAGVLFAAFCSAHANGMVVSGCSDAGLATASQDSVCYSTPVTLSLAGYTGTIFQWQSFDGVQWVNEIGAGATTDTYSVTLAVTGLFRALVTQVSCPTDTSNEVTVTVGTIPVPTAPDISRCGPGIVNLTGTGAGNLKWFASPLSTTPIATGSNTTAFIPSSTTLWLQDNVLGGSSLASALQITEANLGNNDDLEIQNVSPLPVDVTGWKVLISDNYTDINQVNANIQTLNGILQPGDILTWTDLATGPNYWGSNMLWNPGAFPTFTGWILILDASDNPMDFVVWNWPVASIQTMSITVGASTVTPGIIWTGDGIDASVVAATDGLARAGTSDNNNLSDFVVAPLSINATNPQMLLPFTGFGCNSPRIPVEVTINPSDPININASSTSFCQSGSATMTAVSNNTNYNYTWSPATDLNVTTGATVISTPSGPGNISYVVIGDDGTCSNVDTVMISVGAPTVAGTATSFLDTVCLGRTTDLILAGSSGFIQWQHLSGGTWVDETGPGNDSSSYTITPVINTTYRAYLFSGSCPPDSSNLIDITVLSVTDPITTNDSVCGGGAMTLLAAGVGNLNWYDVPFGGSPVNTGSSYTFTSNVTTTYYVETLAGAEYHIGPTSSGIGNQSSTASNDFAMGFDVSRPVTVDVVYVYPAQTGTVTINLRQTAGGPILGTYSQAVTAFQGKTGIPVAFSIPVGTGYRMEVAMGGPTLQQNTTGAVYPYTVANGPLSINGYYNPNFATGGAYFYLYDWVVSEGCRSTRVPVIGVVNSFPPIPTISQNWNILTSSSTIGNQWILNGTILAGATDQFYNATQTGNYAVAVTVNGCTTLSAVFQVLTIGLNDLPGSGISIYPNPVNTSLTISVNEPGVVITEVKITDMIGRTVWSQQVLKMNSGKLLTIPVQSLNNGLYTVELISEESTLKKQFLVAH